MRKPLIAAALLLTGLAVVPGPAAVAASCPGTATPGDFDGDGKADLAVGDPTASTAGGPASGTVSVLYGDDDFKDARTVVLTAQGPATASGFGKALATGYLNDDTCLDLAVGAPWANQGKGRVHLFYGSPDGLKPADVLDPGGDARRYGWSLSIAAKSAQQPALLAVGAPFESVGGKAAAGAVHLEYFSGGGHQRGQVITQDDQRAEGVAEPGDLFGWSVALGRIRGADALDDLIVSEPLEDVDAEGADVGSFSVVEDVQKPGGAKGEHWHFANLGIGETTPGGHIGWSLAYYRDGNRSYVAVGVPGQKVAGKAGAGAVALLSSDGSGLKPSSPLNGGAERAGYGRAVALGLPAKGGVSVLVGAPDSGDRERGTAWLVPWADPGDATEVKGSGDYSHLGASVGFAGATPLAGVPDDHDHPTGSVRTLGDGSTDLVPGQAADGPANADFGAGLA